MSENTGAAAAAQDDWLERALREDGGNHRSDYLADDGFTARVVAALPAPAALPAWRKPAIALLWTAAACGIALALPREAAGAMDEVVRFLSRQPVSIADIGMGAVALLLASWAGTIYALRID
jgi:hypothetical protein